MKPLLLLFVFLILLAAAAMTAYGQVYDGMILFAVGLLGPPAFAVLALPLTLAADRWLRPRWLQLPLFGFLGGAAGRGLPVSEPGSPWTEEPLLVFELWPFALAGLLYAGANLLLTRLGRRKQT
ncbi:hypothetical protein HGI30_02180 [Paenibacillus albicereus]|uniref:Uncharacterized protein n=1 Tax=Paenibacillus albicereus TaxID=2726185 RepID=A0A6H2GSZ5_9BACL|nr:hypothetical protein [Paenibacillus albicereus]QJC50515.1 hypothetical protein HGI30_02180 [Paenibacillus albicereus]